jgi:phospholipase/lecithinase/hemolysin
MVKDIAKAVRRVAGLLLLAAGSAMSQPSLAASTGVAAPPAFERLVVFGDSLSDNGNAGRFSNGPVWVEQLAERLSVALEPARIGGGNFAVGGARLDPRSGPYNLRAQADFFLSRPPSRERTLYIVYGGGNDLLAAVGSPAGAEMTDVAVATLKGILSDLVRHGAEDILVPNLPNVGLTPAVRSDGDRAVAQAGELTHRYNAALDRVLDALPDGPRLYRLDVRELAERALADPEAFGFRNVTAPCNGLPDCEGYLFWDYVHPTTTAHGRLAEAALRVLGGGPSAP